MDEVIEEFEERVVEVAAFLKVLERLENPDVVLVHRRKRRRLRVLKDSSHKVMKATVFLLIYNLVESAIRSAFRQLYTTIEVEKKTAAELRRELRRVWVGQQFDKFAEGTASLRNYREVAEKLADQIIEDTAIRLSADLLPVSGNLDADVIRKVCHSHGIPVRTHFRALGGCELETVKRQRNALGHGDVSFSACGQQYAVTDLKRIHRQSVVFVRSILKNIRRYVEEAAFSA